MFFVLVGAKLNIWIITPFLGLIAILYVLGRTLGKSIGSTFGLYDEMAEPKYVIAVGGCAISGGPFKSSYHVVKGIEEFLPVDVFIPGCPPRPEAILYGMMQLQRKVKVEKFFGGANHKQTKQERELGVSNEELMYGKKPMVINEVPEDFIDEMRSETLKVEEESK